MTESDRALGLSLSPSSGLHALRSVFKRFVRIVFKPPSFGLHALRHGLYSQTFRKCRFGQEILNCFLNFLKKSETNF